MKRNLLIIGLPALVLVLLAVVWLSRSHTPPRPPPLPRGAMSFARTTADAKVALTLAPALARYPGLRLRLYDDGVKELTEFLQSAGGDRAHALAKGRASPIYERKIAWTLEGATPKLVSARESWFDFTGAAHPDHGQLSMLWDPIQDLPVEREDLLRPGADQGRLDRILCQAVRWAETTRQTPGQGAGQDVDDWPCPHWRDSRFVLAPSTTPGKLGGVIFLFDPATVGPYAQGDYTVTVPQALIHADLSPAWASEFAGAPEPAPAPAAKAA